jgi:hypothetical protein
MVEELLSSETSVLTRTAWHNIPEDGILYEYLIYIPEDDILYEYFIYIP